MKVAVLGLGLIGKRIHKEIESIGITRNNYNQYKGEHFDIFINANGNSKKYLAIKDPVKDFELTVGSVYKTLYDFSFNNYIYISSVDVFENNIYGYHKRITEQLITEAIDNYKFFRCGAVIDEEMKKGVLYDLVNDLPLRITLNSRIQVITAREIARCVKKYMKDPRIRITLTSNDSILISDMCKLLNKNILPVKDAQYISYEHKPTFKMKSCEEYIKEVI